MRRCGMEDYSGCYDSVIEIVDDATKKFDGLYILNEKKYAALEAICDMVDDFVSEIEPNFVDVSVDTSSKQLTFDIGCDDLVLERGSDELFFAIIRKMGSFSFSKTKNGGLCIALNVNGLWERIYG
jgi:hypothetical protein